jgi:hypothetical protein
MRLSKGNLSGRQKWVLALLFIMPLLVVVGKWPALPTSGFLTRFFSLAELPASMENRLRYILFVPLGATLVVLFRLTLGIRLLGPFRSILLALAFQITGIAFGLVFMAMVIGAIVALRPFLRAIRLPYFGRVSVMLGAVAAILMVTLLSSEWLGVEALRRVAYFPMVVLCLTGDGFARTLSREGLRSAMWRGVTTAFAAVLITLLSQTRAIENILLHFPELLITQVGCVVAIAEFLDLRLLHWLNPPLPKKRSVRRKKRSKRRAKKKRRSSAKAGRQERVMEVPYEVKRAALPG